MWQLPLLSIANPQVSDQIKVENPAITVDIMVGIVRKGKKNHRQGR
jgi:hypothetical protein